MQVYKLTNDERLLIEATAVVASTVLVICDYGGEVGCVVNYVDLIDSLYANYFALLTPLDEDRIVEYVPDMPF